MVFAFEFGFSVIFAGRSKVIIAAGFKIGSEELSLSLEWYDNASKIIKSESP